MEVNSDYMYFQNPSSTDGECDWIENSNPDSTDFSTLVSALLDDLSRYNNRKPLHKNAYISLSQMCFYREVIPVIL